MIYFLRRSDGLVKIGTTTNYRARLSQLITEHGDLELLGLMDGSYEVESQLHERFDNERVAKEWFKPSPGLIEYITHHASPSIPDEKTLVIVGVTRHTRFALDILTARFTALSGQSKTPDTVIWELIEQLDPLVVNEVEALLGSKPKVRRGRVKITA